jgi:P27 family predicted phage terminase small subunit
MAGRGPAPVPSALRVLRGARPPKVREPKPARGRPKTPADLSETEHAAWLEVVRELERVPGLCTRADRGVVELLARTLPVWREAMRHVREHGGSLVVRDEKGVVKFLQQTPEMTIAIKLGASLKSLYAELGLTPAGRTRVDLAPVPVADALSTFLQKRSG